MWRWQCAGSVRGREREVSVGHGRTVFKYSNRSERNLNHGPEGLLIRATCSEDTVLEAPGGRGFWPPPGPDPV